MNILAIEAKDIDKISVMQPADWSDVRPYFYYYVGATHCDPIKITENGEILAVGTTIRHEDSAWLAHIIVHPDHRGKGLGKSVVTELLNRLPQAQRRTIYLDATDMGFPLYEKLGFVTEAAYTHLNGNTIDLALGSDVEIVPFHPDFARDILTLDKVVSAENRQSVLKDHLPFCLIALENKRINGVYYPTLFDGFIAALSREAGEALMKIRMRTRATARIPSGNAEAIDFLTRHGHERSGSSRRMVLGEKRIWQDTAIYNRISGGLG